MNKIIIFDFEVFKFDTLLGADVIDLDTYKIERFQTWDLNAIRKFYWQHVDHLWVGHNNDAYDNHILKHILEGENEEQLYKTSKSIVNNDGFRPKAKLDILSYDLMCCNYYSLKMTELLVGKAIERTEVDFDTPRPLNAEEKAKTLRYNGFDLDQTTHNFFELCNPMMLRLNLIREFNIDKKYLTATEARLAAMALGARQIPGIQFKYVAPKMYDTLQVKNKDVINFYLSEGFRKGQNITVKLCGVENKMGAGGLHGALKKCHETDFLYLDVSGYYNLVMILYDLLPRTIPESGKKLYEYMYHQQLALKGVDDDKRWVYKTILLAVFGASINEHTDFYDPQIGTLITITGQMFIIDLLEKLDGKVKLIQSNTDGIMVKPLPTSSDEEVLAIVKEWCDRTGFVIKPKKVKEIYQRDVNCYCYKLPDGSTDTKGDAFIGSWAIDEPVKNAFWSAEETAIVAKATLAYLMFGTPIEETVMNNKDKILWFQYLCRKNTYSYCTYDTYNVATGQTTSVRVDDLNRCFALKYDGTLNIITKHKMSVNKKTGIMQEKKSKLSSMPDNYFIYNDEVLSDEAIAKLQEKIDYQFYIDRAYERVATFFDIRYMKGLKL